MKILLVGGNGTIGKRLAVHFSQKHQVVVAGRNSGEVRVDIADADSIAAMYQKLGRVDAVVCAAGDAKWAEFESLAEEDYYVGIKSKLMGQVNLVRLGLGHMSRGGSFTLSSGILADHPVRMTAGAALVGGAIHSFVRAASLELENGLRINAVSSGLVEDAVDKYRDYFPGHNPIPHVEGGKRFCKKRGRRGHRRDHQDVRQRLMARGPSEPVRAASGGKPAAGAGA